MVRLFVCLGIIPQVQASISNTPREFKTMIDQADLVFRGVVTDVKYKNSTPVAPQSSAVPYTFVTYTIHEVLSGDYTDNTITLRFFGGVNETNHDLFSYSSAIPLFDVGEEDILFVAGNTENDCPLVSCPDGRIRVINDQLYDEEGNELVSINAGKSFAKGQSKSHDLKEVREHHINGQTFTLTSTPEPIASPSITSSAIKPVPTAVLEQLNKSQSAKKLERSSMIATLKTTQRSKKANKVHSARRELNFTITPTPVVTSLPKFHDHTPSAEEKAYLDALMQEAAEQRKNFAAQQGQGD